MKTYLIKRKVPGAGNLTPAQLKQISEKSCAVLGELGPQIEWQQSYVTGENLWCIYKAENEEIIHQHARIGDFPLNGIYEIATIIGPATAKLAV